MSSHPSTADLERLACGEGAALVPEIVAHVEACVECKQWIERTTRSAASFGGRNDPERFVDGMLARAEARPSRSSLSPSPVVRLFQQRVFWAAAPLAAAALLLILVRTLPTGTKPVATEGPGEPLTPSAPAVAATDTTFKGKTAVAVVRERGGAQDRLVGTEIEIAAYDRIRVELALDTTRPIAAGVLAEDGSWAPLIAPALLDAGTHFSESSVRFDDSPSAGWLLVGDPEAVTRARATRSFEGLHVLRIRPTK